MPSGSGGARSWGRVLVVDVDRWATAARLNLDEPLSEESADTPDQSLTLAQDDRVSSQLGANLREDVLEPAPAIGVHRQRLQRLAGWRRGRQFLSLRFWCGCLFAHVLTTPIVSTLIPDAISL